MADRCDAEPRRKRITSISIIFRRDGIAARSWVNATANGGAVGEETYIGIFALFMVSLSTDASLFSRSWVAVLDSHLGNAFITLLYLSGSRHIIRPFKKETSRGPGQSGMSFAA